VFVAPPLFPLSLWGARHDTRSFMHLPFADRRAVTGSVELKEGQLRTLCAIRFHLCPFVSASHRITTTNKTCDLFFKIHKLRCLCMR
jgi:hypothetical protein